MLTEYKQQTVVEQHFAFVKDPKAVGPVYVKKLERVQALAWRSWCIASCSAGYARKWYAKQLHEKV
ncbi:MAG: hypothetical protein AB1445_04025 [Bacillota bacterium]